MFLGCRLETALLCLLAMVVAGGSQLGLKADPSTACPSPAGCDSTESHNQALCHGRSCGGARASGEPCGVYTPSCVPGLRCIPRPGERAPLHALLRGKGICAAGGGKKGGGRNQTEVEPLAGDGWKETHGTGHPTLEPLPLKSQDPLQEAPCRVHLAAILQELKAPLYLNGEDIFIPNCDTKGFYRRKQCRASKGQKRGQCWCVDKRGHRLEALEENPLCLLVH